MLTDVNVAMKTSKTWDTWRRKKDLEKFRNGTRIAALGAPRLLGFLPGLEVKSLYGFSVAKRFVCMIQTRDFIFTNE